jgi:antitoxin (DNA-binding transcriptional repressor) of toxin-antitoxin stability system
MARTVSVRQLRNETAEVVSALQAGERLQLTVNRTPVADIVPHVPERGPWVSSDEVRRILVEAPADHGLLEDLAGVRGQVVDDWE